MKTSPELLRASRKALSPSILSPAIGADVLGEHSPDAIEQLRRCLGKGCLARKLSGLELDPTETEPVRICPGVALAALVATGTTPQAVEQGFVQSVEECRAGGAGVITQVASPAAWAAEHPDTLQRLQPVVQAA